MTDLTQQEMFDKAYTGVVNQGERCHNGYDCVYLNEENGHMCALGHVMKGIVDDASPLWEAEGGVYSLLNDAEDEEENLDWLVKHKYFAAAIQDAHDTCNNEEAFVGDFKRKMDHVATEYNLVVPNLGGHNA